MAILDFPGAEKLHSDGLYLCDPKGSVEQLGSCENGIMDVLMAVMGNAISVFL